MGRWRSLDSRTVLVFSARRRPFPSCSKGCRPSAINMAQEFGFTREEDRRSSAGTVPDLVGGSREGPLRGCAGSHFGVDRLAHRLSRSCRRCRGPCLTSLVDHPYARTHILRRDGITWPRTWDIVRAKEYRPDVWFRDSPDHLPRRDLLPMDSAHPGESRRMALAPDHRAYQSSYLYQRRNASCLSLRRAHTCISTSSIRYWLDSAGCSSVLDCTTSAERSFP